MIKNLIMAVFLSAAVVNCSSGTPEEPEPATGTARLPLQTTGSSGNVYQLQNAEISFLAEDGSLSSFVAPAGEDVFEVLRPVGTYDVELVDGWSMLRVLDDGATREVAAVLASANPVTDVVIADGTTTDIVFLFNVGAETIPFGNGEARVLIGVNETGAPVCDLTDNVPPGGCTVDDPASCVCTGCNTDGSCGIDDDCTCADCEGLSFCQTSCNNDGICSPWTEGCECADCETQALCRPFQCDLTKGVGACSVNDAVACACEGCIDNGVCDGNEDCACPDCNTDTICDGCNNDGVCRPWVEGCACADCAAHPECAG